MIVLGGIVLLYYFAGILTNGFSGGLVKGTIERPQYIHVFLLAYFFYHFFMFWLYLQREMSTHNFTVNSLNSFSSSVARYIIKREIGKYFRQFGLEEDYEPKNLSQQTSSENLVQLRFTLDPEVRQKFEMKIQELPGFKLDKQAVFFEYTISDTDKKFYEENKDYLQNIVLHEFMDYKFPIYFGVLVVLVIIGVNICTATKLGSLVVTYLK